MADIVEKSGAKLVGETHKGKQAGEEIKEQMESGKEKKRKTSISSLTCETRPGH